MAQPVPRPEPVDVALPPASPTLLRIPGATPEDADTFWLREVYQGDRVPQLTLRAVLLGSAIGVCTCAINLYAGLKGGVISGVAVMAGLLAHGGHGALRRLVPRVGGAPLSSLELCCAQAVASAAGYATGSALVSYQGAWLLMTGHHPPGWTLLAWTLLLSALGVFFAVPLKRQFVDREQLPFATGTAAALTVRALEATSAGARSRLRALGWGGVISGLVTLGRDGLGRIPAGLAWPGAWGAIPLERLGFALSTNLLFVGSGALLGFRITASMLLGSLLMYGVIAPRLVAAGALPPDAGVGEFRGWGMWPGAVAITTASLLHLALQGRALGRALRSLWPAPSAAAPHPLDALQVPRSWWLAGVMVLAPASVALAHVGFGVPVLHAVLAVALSFLLCIIACRIVGETDVSSPDTLGAVTQLTSSVLQPRSPVVGLVTAGVTVNTTSSAADLLSDLKTGHLLGAHPRRQFIAQLLGSAVGAAVMVPLFYLLVPDREALGGERFPAWGATTAVKMAEVFSGGLSGLAPSLSLAVVQAALAAALLTLAGHMLPERARGWVPSPVGVGLGCLLPPVYSIGFFIGGCAAAVVQRRRPAAMEERLLPLATGLIAGEGLVGIGIYLLGMFW
jgi:uncharacterized oligopeptide transporter (OPT) family protein